MSSELGTSTTTLYRTGEAVVTHMQIANQIREIHGYDSALLFFRENPGIAYEMCMRVEEKLTTAYVILHCNTANLERIIQVSSDETSRTKADLERIIQAKDECIKHIQDKNEAEQHELKSMLGRANTETLKLAHSLSVRGMIEKIELQYSDKRQKDGAAVSRRTVWMDILHESEKLRQAVTKNCPGRNTASKTVVAVEAILEIYRLRSEEIHNAGYDEIPVKIDLYHGLQLDILRNLCTATHYLIKEI